MNGKDRVTAAIARRKADRPALSYEATYEVTEALIRHLGIDRSVTPSAGRSSSNQPAAGTREFGMSHELELSRRLGIDQSIVICPTNSAKTVGNWWGLPLLERLPDGRLRGRIRRYRTCSRSTRRCSSGRSCEQGGTESDQQDG
jgi:hypothetical protein